MRYFRILPKYIICKRVPVNASEFCRSQQLKSKLFFFRNYFGTQPVISHSNVTNVVDSVQTGKPSFEREYFEKVIKDNPDYEVHKPADDLLTENRLSTNKLVVAMRDLTRMPEVIFDDEFNFNFLSKDFLDSSFTANDIIEILIRLPQSRIDNKRHIEQLEKLLCTKINALKKRDKFDELLVVLHLLKNFHKLKLVGCSLISYLSKHQKKFTKLQLIKYYYTLHFFTTFPVYKKMSFDVDVALSERLADMTVDEIAIIAYALFRCRISTQQMCCTAVAKKLLEDLDHVNAVQASVLSKFLGVNVDHRQGKIISDILEKFIPIMSNFPLLPAIRVALVGATVNVVNCDLMKQIIKRVLIAPECLRLKDYERLLLATTMGNIDLRLERDFVQLITKQLKERETEIRHHPLSYVSVLSRLALHEIYIDEECRFAFSEDFRKLFSRKSQNSLHELLHLDVALELERPDYKGIRLSDRQRDKITKADYYRASDLNITAASKCNYEIKNYLLYIYGAGCCVVKYLIPYFCTLNAVLCVNKKNEPQEIGSRLNGRMGQVVRPPKDDNLWICFLIVRHPGCLWNTIIPNVGTVGKIRHLKLAGYHPLMIMLYEWSKKTEEERQLFLKKIIREEVEKLNKG